MHVHTHMHDLPSLTFLHHITYTLMHVHMIYACSCCSSKHINLIINLTNKSCKTCCSIDSKLKLMKSKLSRLQICIWNEEKQQEHQNPKIWISRLKHAWEYMKYAYTCMKQALCIPAQKHNLKIANKMKQRFT